jgi:hypothetical protein
MIQNKMMVLKVTLLFNRLHWKRQHAKRDYTYNYHSLQTVSPSVHAPLQYTPVISLIISNARETAVSSGQMWAFSSSMV